jgi:hypothetical protein
MIGDDDDDGDGDAVDADDLPDLEDGVPSDCWNRRSRLLLRSMVCVCVCVLLCQLYVFFSRNHRLYSIMNLAVM